MGTEGNAAGLIDTDILVDAARGRSEAIDYLADLQARSSVTISAVTAMELVAGCRDKQQLADAQDFLQRLTILHISEPVSRTAFDLMSKLHLGHGLLLPDALIAATALEHGLVLMSRNIRHYRMVPSLRVASPY